MFIRFLFAVALLDHGFASSVKHESKIDLKLSDEDPGTKDYDHEAFLGEETKQTFDQLSPAESRRRLGIIFDKIDLNQDGNVTEEELEKWITFTQTRYVSENTEKEFNNNDPDKDGKITWEEYYEKSFGMLKENDDWKVGEDQGFSYLDMYARDKKRWQVADTDHDNACIKTEYQAFLHPQHFPRMRDIVFDETMDDIDKDKDGFVSIDEYIRDVYRPEKENEPEPDWVEVERKYFLSTRDQDKDGKLNKQEVRAWILPDDYEPANAEARHLIFASDVDQDGSLTRDEMLMHQDVFVGSQATDWGEMFNRHDEF